MRGILTIGEDSTIGGAFSVLDMRGRKNQIISRANTSGNTTDIGSEDRMPAGDESSISDSSIGALFYL